LIKRLAVFSGFAILVCGQAPRALLDQYCVTCHNDKVKTGGLTLAGDQIDAFSNCARV
jgi:hypothetical protein